MMDFSPKIVADVAVRLPTAAFLLWLLYRRLLARRPLPGFIRLPLKAAGFVLLIATIGVLGGCANPDPLAVASGPLYPLNAGHWQPTPQDLSAPPLVAHN